MTFPHRQRTAAGACVAALTAAFPVCFLEPALNHNNPHSIYNTMSDTEREGNKYTSTIFWMSSTSLHNDFFLLVSDLGLPDQVENMCPLLPSLDQALAEVKELAGAGAGACQLQYVHVTEVVLPMLCSYMSLWWHWGPEGQPDSPVCTSVTPQCASDLLGLILQIIQNHMGISQGDWMKQMAGTAVLPVTVVQVFLFSIPYMNLFFSSLLTITLAFSLFSVSHMSCLSQAPKKPLPAIDGKTEEKGRECATGGGADESRGR